MALSLQMVPPTWLLGNIVDIWQVIMKQITILIYIIIDHFESDLFYYWKNL